MKLCNKIIEYSFYALFVLVPLIFMSNTSELFEFNKMWITFGLTIIITATWLSKIIIGRKIGIKRTPLDIPIILFLISQIISTLLSLDIHVSIWGYYSRFNGGLLSTISYILLYYAFVSNLSTKQVLRSLKVTLFTGFLVSLWGLPSHFGYDPTCLVFRGSLDTSCWTEAFKPTIRSFSTLGQPAWFAAYLALLLPLNIAFAIKQQKQLKNGKWTLKNGKFTSLYLLSALFYLNLIFTDTRAGLIAFWIGNALFWAIIFYKKILSTPIFRKSFLIFNLSFVIFHFFFGGPIGPLTKFTFPQIINHTITKAHAQQPQTTTQQPPSTPKPANDINITDSGTIRLLVWKGAINAWKANPLFGTGVETFAYAYYQFRPQEHNLTSEWDYLYNKAHNEYLNYLATTGIFGLGTYLAIIAIFIFLSVKYLIKSPNSPPTNQKQSPTIKSKHSTANGILDNDHWTLDICALLCAYITILISNFFGFSVVIMNLYLFLIPAFFFILISSPSLPSNNKPYAIRNTPINLYQWAAIILIIFTAGCLIIGLFQYWYADTAYALGSNLDKTGNYQEAYPQLLQAAKTEPSEPTYKDELSVNAAVLATALIQQKDTKNGVQFAQNAVALSDEISTSHPNNVVFWKDRVRIFYSLAQADPKHQGQYLTEALKAIQKANQLAPTDAKISYNLGILYGQTGNVPKGKEILEKTIQLKPDYKDAYYALGLFYHQLATNTNVLGASTSAEEKNQPITDPQMQQKAIDTMHYILTNFSAKDQATLDALKSWNTN